jgi:hypothetical protein
MPDQSIQKETHCPHQCPHSLGDHVSMFFVDDSKSHVVDYTAFRELGLRAAQFRAQKVFDLLLNRPMKNE